ncbi:MAG: YraN family protein [Helicobacter sp.]|uniref:YraN family protein n=1 Tax=Helicobacter sp. TaxID=218 RepID=UPI0025C3697B|nr:YraN family protein [Helicobacter sp.]MCH5313520.1 YraN family protein [Helicobacter sp.]
MSRQKGAQAEEVACAFLRKNGFEILERNFFARYGEIDIIARKDEVLHFIEVKSGVGFEPIYNITPSKLVKLHKAIGLYISTHHITQAYCLDALIIKDGQCEMIENITFT